MSETWFPTPTTPSGRAAGMRQLSRLTAGLSIGAIAATGATAVAVGVHQLEAQGVQLLPAALTGGGLGGDDGGSSALGSTSTGGGGSGAVVPAAPSGGVQPGLIQVAPGGTAHATTGGS
ncbi:MAG: hypothetical protein KQH57_12090 [Actinomycetales bacterium]|nr:hypothetical protein [Actinomycetales bacterium]